MSEALLATAKGSSSPWRQGNLYKREKGIIRNTWKDRFVILFEGSIFYYQATTDITPRGVFHLMGAKLDELPEKKLKRKHCFSITLGREELIFACADDEEMKNWMSLIKENLNRAPAPPPSKAFTKLKVNKSSSTSVYLTGKIADTIVNTGAGGKLVREFLTDDAILIIDSLKNFLVLKIGQEKADNIEKYAISIAIKIAIFHKDKRITKADITACMGPIRLLASKAIDGFEIPFTFSAMEIVEAILAVKAAVEKLTSQILTEKSHRKFEEIFNTFANEDLVEDFFEKKKWRECEIIATTLRELWDNGRF